MTTFGGLRAYCVQKLATNRFPASKVV
jgi:hypothetical protein